MADSNDKGLFRRAPEIKSGEVLPGIPTSVSQLRLSDRRRRAAGAGRAHRIFVGPSGMRSGWSLALYLGMFALILVVGGWWAEALHFGELWSQMFSELGVLVAAVIPALVMARIEGGRGVPMACRCARRFQKCSGWERSGDFSAITLLLEILHGLHAFDFGHVVLHGARIVKFAIFWGVVFLLVGFVEEFLLRGYTQFTLARGIGFWPAAALLSTAFGASHLKNPAEAWTGALAAGLHWPVLLSHTPPHREFVVCGRISCRLGLGRELLLFRAG